MKKQFLVFRFKFLASPYWGLPAFLKTQNSKLKTTRAFTLIETLVAVSLLSVAIVAPMSLVAQSLSSAYYARDQVTAFNLAQEGVEEVRAVRDGNILENAVNNSNRNLLEGIPIGQPFTVDAHQTIPSNVIVVCQTNPCPALQTDGTIYGYESGWTETLFTRTLTAEYVGSGQDEIRVSVTVSWPTKSFQIRTFTIYENMYRWINDGSAAR